jgi:uncharacterized protein YbjQ (UPF0145 family)
MGVMTGLSGNEMYCMHLKGYAPGGMVIGNSVYSMGFVGGLGAGLRSALGGEVTQVTDIIHEGRQESYDRMVKEATELGGAGITGVTSELKRFHGNIEFLSVASCVHQDGAREEEIRFSTSGDGQELFCMMDAGYTPIKFVFGNVAYSIGVGGGLLGALKSMGRGEIKEYSNIFNHTRHLALGRIVQEAQTVGANAVVGIETTVMPFQGVHEMMMMGTAAKNPDLPFNSSKAPITSDLTCAEMWNLTHMGYVPLKLVLGTAVYSLGVVGGLKAMLKSFSKGEVHDLTSLIYDAREHAIGLIADEANSIGADDVVGIKTHIHEMGGLLEFMAIGTAVKRFDGIKTQTDILPPQAIIKDKDTWVNYEDQAAGVVLESSD